MAETTQRPDAESQRAAQPSRSPFADGNLPPGFSRSGKILFTPHGPLYEPATGWRPIVFVVAAFFLCPAVGWLASLPVPGLTDNTRLLYAVPPALVFFLGYSVWVSRLRVIGFQLIGRGLLRALWTLVIHRRKPDNAQEFLPTPDTLARAAVSAQRAASSFLLVAIPLALAGAFIGMATGTGPLVPRLVLCPLATLLCGWLLARLGRRGCLPLPDADAV